MAEKMETIEGSMRPEKVLTKKEFEEMKKREKKEENEQFRKYIKNKK